VTATETALRRIQRHLLDCGVPFALVGGLAISVRTEPRFTRDADLVVAVADDSAAEHPIHELQRRAYAISAVVEEEPVGRLATVRLTDSQGAQPMVIDLLFASSGIEHEIAAEAEALEILPELVFPVARIGHLIALKILSRDDVARPQDVIDLRALRRVASPADRSVARESLSLITLRGYHRGRDLLAAIDAALPDER
jgi:hypothetical protein